MRQRRFDVPFGFQRHRKPAFRSSEIVVKVQNTVEQYVLQKRSEKKTEIKNFKLLPHQVKVIFKHISVGLSSAW